MGNAPKVEGTSSGTSALSAGLGITVEPKKGTTMELYDVVKKLIGPIEPVGDSHIDAERLENLKVACDLVDKLVQDINAVAFSVGDHMASVKAAKNYADGFIRLTLCITE